ncbi:glycosyltransferase family 9 protein, partial [Poseidonibacter sp.]|uniref:glycosyltransferase family 9 protein n=1 Tax=Poseidonibacter sp. TaxID=2321188 RepID=UPI003C777868
LQIMMSKAKLKIGYPYRSIRRLFYDIATLRSDLVLESHSIQHMINLLGAQDTKLEYGYENKYPKNIKKQIIYFPGAAVQVKCWEDKKFIQLIDSLSKKYPQYEHVILQGIKEDEKFENIYQPFVKKQNVLLQPKMECDNVMQFISNASCLISNDTGIRNIAIALETPTVGIFFATAAFRYWPRDEKHEAVFNVEYTSPDVNDVYQKTTQIMNRLYGASR